MAPYMRVRWRACTSVCACGGEGKGVKGKGLRKRGRDEIVSAVGTDEQMRFVATEKMRLEVAEVSMKKVDDAR